MNTKIDEKQKLDSIKNLKKQSLIGKDVVFKGMIDAEGPFFPVSTEIAFECMSCLRLCNVKQEIQIPTTEDKPDQCKECGGRSFRPLSEYSSYTDAKIATVTDVLNGEYGKSEKINLLIEGDQAHEEYLGELVEVEGILRKNGSNSPFVKVKKIKSLNKHCDVLTLTKEDESKIMKLSEDPNILDEMVESFTGSISGLSDVKKSLILQLFVCRDSSAGEFDFKPVHSLIVSENEDAKEEMLKYVAEISPISTYIDGKSSKIQIIPKYIPSYGNKLLKTGLLGLSDEGVLCINNINSLRHHKDYIKIAMESQILDTYLEGPHGTSMIHIPTNISLLSSIKPLNKLNKRKTIEEQIRMDSNLFKEFDLVFVIAKENTISDHSKNVKKGLFDTELFQKYISFAKCNINPKLRDKKVKETIHNFYMNLREEYGVYLINGKRLMSIIELAKASARTKLKDTVTVEDAELAINVYKNSLKHLGIDLGDHVNINSIITKREKKELIMLIKHIIGNSGEKEGIVPLKFVIKKTMDQSNLTETMVKLLIKDLNYRVVYAPKKGYLKLIT